ncbi:hypothetical protein QI633_19480 [Nocardioides sp. QY071]|uniref:hypothetical protein n=1 Tax=Nocardioides sp. QY071 TaxID=3044187 RepID=UPI00249AD9B9|nr:hypothetical protein [Nocardioides sp. QY071]WGY00710.1 hypothetical protein QI633_19480 [Nocardioides sp. QY071]
MSFSSHLSRRMGGGTLLAVVLVGSLAACSDDAATDAPVAVSSSDAPATTAQSPAPSDLQARPEAQAVQRWASAFAEVVNADQDDLAAAAPTMTEAGLERMALYTRRERGRYFPGPLPVTVVGIAKPNAKGVTLVRACVWIAGWSQKSASDPQREPREVIPVVIGVVEQDGEWRVDGMGDREKGSCAGVEVSGQGSAG